MDTHAPERTTEPAATSATGPAQATGRCDIYAGIHKALRLFMSHALCQVGSTDPASDAEVASMLGLLERLLSICELHLKDENEFVHPALEAARAGSSARIAGEHEHHGEAIADLRDLAGLVRDSHGQARAAASARLYRALALFVADNFQHMHVEETAHNAVLWARYSDDELMAIEQAIVASIPPAAMFEALHWLLPALNGPERAAMLAGMQQGMPPEPFVAILDIARRTLPSDAHAALMRALGLPPVR